MIKTTANKATGWKKDYFMPNQEHPVSYKREVVERNGQNMKDKLLHGFPKDPITKDIYVRHPSMRSEIKDTKGKGRGKSLKKPDKKDEKQTILDSKNEDQVEIEELPDHTSDDEALFSF